MRNANAKATASFAMDKKTEKIPKILMILKKKTKVQKSKTIYYVFPGHLLRKFYELHVQ